MGHINATLAASSPRYADWRRVFGDDRVPLESPAPVVASAPGIARAPFLKVAVRELAPDQLERAVVHLARRFERPADEVREELLGDHGLPILAADVLVVVDARLLVG